MNREIVDGPLEPNNAGIFVGPFFWNTRGADYRFLNGWR
jgi:hypothetical protein